MKSEKEKVLKKLYDACEIYPNTPELWGDNEGNVYTKRNGKLKYLFTRTKGKLILRGKDGNKFA